MVTDSQQLCAESLIVSGNVVGYCGREYGHAGSHWCMVATASGDTCEVELGADNDNLPVNLTQDGRLREAHRAFWIRLKSQGQSGLAEEFYRKFDCRALAAESGTEVEP